VHALGIDLGGTHARAALVDAQGRIVDSLRSKLSERTPEAVTRGIAEAVQQLFQQNPHAEKTMSGCGVGVAGQLDAPKGLVKVAPNLGWRDVPFGQMLQQALGHPVKLFNDLTAAAWGELHVGAGRGIRDMLVVFVGSGVGSAIISDGRLVRGAHGLAGEFGHVKVVPGGRQCGCGEKGCLEAYVGGHHLIAQMQELAAKPEGSALRQRVGGDLKKLTPVVLEDAVREGDPAAQALHSTAVGHLALAVANYVTVLNPARLVLGGGVLSRCPLMREQLGKGVATLGSLLARQRVEVVDAALGDDSGVIGAALLALPNP
jgi:glucokinase